MKPAEWPFRHRSTPAAFLARAGRLSLALALALATPLGVAIAGPDAARSRPNVVLIISDDQAWTDYGFMGHPVIRTPHIDRLAKESALYTRGYVTTSLCRPSLATLITGLYPHQHGITGNDVTPGDGRWTPGLRRDPAYLALADSLCARIERVPTLPRLLATLGYVSFQAGKWWEGSYARGGFTEGMTHGDPLRGGRHGDDGLAIGRDGMESIAAFLDGTGGAPFFLWYAPFLPHAPHDPPERILERYRAPGRPEAIARYWAMCEWFDESCGALLALLEERRLSDDTLVVYITDNGWIQRTAATPVPKGWNQAFAPGSKQHPEDGGVRTPVILRWPGHIPPGRHDSLVSAIDIAPTILSAVGAPSLPSLPGLDLLDSAIGGEPLPRSAIFGEIYAHDIPDLDRPEASLLYRWVISDRWKLVRQDGGRLGRYAPLHRGRSESLSLHDLLLDPLETRDLAAERPDEVARLSETLDAWYSPR